MVGLLCEPFYCLIRLGAGNMGKAHFELRLLPVNGDGESPPIATFQAHTTLGLWMLVPDALGFSYLEHMAALARVAPGNPGDRKSVV